MSTLRVEWVNGNQQWMITGGGLPNGAAWDGFDDRETALEEAHRIGEDIYADITDCACEQCKGIRP